MYLDYFGLSQAPFQIAPDDRFLYLSQKHAKALVYMDYAAWQPDGFVVVTGEIGSGKSTLIKRLIRKLKEKVVCFHLPFTNLNDTELLSYMARQANIRISTDDKVSIIYALSDYFKEITASGIPCLLIVDEAQNLSESNLEDIRMLAGLEGDNGTLLRVVMLGQPEFMNTVNASEQMKQRVKLHYHLVGLDEKEVDAYINYRLELSGLPHQELFNEEMIESIYRLSGGIPRLINKICDSLLICAFSENKKKPEISDFEEVAQDLMMIPSEGVNKKVPSVLDENTQSSLERIATALETISNHFEALSEPDTNKKDRGFLGLRAAK